MRFSSGSLSGISALALCILPVTAFAETLSGQALKDLVEGRTVYLAAPLGGEFPLKYRPDGTVTGDGESVGLGRFFATRETGRWYLTGTNLCQQFPTWYNGQRLCFSVRKLDGNRIRWTRDNGETGIARVADR
jgi:hypothetical protein